MAVAVQGFHSQDEDIVLAPDWLIERLACSYGDMVTLEFIDETLQKANTVTLRPAMTTSTDSPVFVECLTEAFNKLGILQLGTVSIQLDPSLPEQHTFIVESMTPGTICLADGEVTIDFLAAIDHVESVEESVVTTEFPTLEPCDFSSMISSAPTTGFTPFSGQGRRLG